MLAINLVKAQRRLVLPGPADVYTLTAPELRSASVLLNGRALAVGPDDRFPALRPRRLKRAAVTLPPISISFIALPQARNPNC